MASGPTQYAFTRVKCFFTAALACFIRLELAGSVDAVPKDP
jgi:hypothetical protein